jgi:hypothetical protein
MKLDVSNLKKKIVAELMAYMEKSFKRSYKLHFSIRSVLHLKTKISETPLVNVPIRTSN